MKRLKGIFCVVALAVFLFTTVPVVCATWDKENFQKAGAELKDKCEALLEARALGIRETFFEVPRDGYVTKAGMLRLENRIERFEKSKIDYDAALKLYGLRTETILDPIYRKIVDVYFLRDEMNGRTPNDFFYGDNQNETIRRIFAERFGVDVKIWRGVNKAGWAKCSFLVLAFFVCLIFLICGFTDYLRFRWTACFVILWFLFFILPI